MSSLFRRRRSQFIVRVLMPIRAGKAERVTYVGPFKTSDAASVWIAEQTPADFGGLDATVQPLQPPR